MKPSVEAAAAGAAGAVLAGGLGLLAGPAVAVPIAAVAGVNGAVSGWRGVYAWRRPKGVAAFALDSTWALATTSAGLFAHAVAALRGDPQYQPGLSARRNRHVYGRGFQPRKGFAITLGNVVSGAGDVANARRAKLVTDHEDVHVWQARWLGPVYPLAYGGCAAAGAAVGAVLWTARRGKVDAPGRASFGKFVETCAYYCNPLEYWAYSRDDHWPPTGIVPGVGPRRPIVKSFAALGKPRT